MTTIVVSGQTLVFKTELARKLKSLSDEAQILNAILPELLDSKDLPTQKENEVKAELFPKKLKRDEICLDGSIEGDEFSEHLGFYKSRNLECFVNVKKRLNELGYTVIVSSHKYSKTETGHARLVWKILRKEKKVKKPKTSKK